MSNEQLDETLDEEIGENSAGGIDTNKENESADVENKKVCNCSTNKSVNDSTANS